MLMLVNSGVGAAIATLARPQNTLIGQSWSYHIAENFGKWETWADLVIHYEFTKVLSGRGVKYNLNLLSIHMCNVSILYIHVDCWVGVVLYRVMASIMICWVKYWLTWRRIDGALIMWPLVVEVCVHVHVVYVCTCMYLTEFSTDWLTDWLTDWPTDWLCVSVCVCVRVVSVRVSLVVTLQVVCCKKSIVTHRNVPTNVAMLW